MKVVRFVKTYRMYQPGERAGFAKAEADALIAQGLAVDPDVVAEQQKAAAEAERQKLAAEEEAATQRRAVIAEVISALPEDGFTKSGVPEVDAINALLNDRLPDFAKHDQVTAAERDAVWAEAKA